jgi:hypothetical protein
VPDERLARYRAAALAFAAYLLVIAGSAAVLFALKLGGTPARLVEHYLGSEAAFRPPRSLDGLLEVAVPHLLAMPLALFAVSHVVGWARAVGRRAYRALVAISFGAALLGIASAFGIRFVAPGLAWAKIVAFVATEASLLAWAALLVRLFAPAFPAAGARPRTAADHARSRGAPARTAGAARSTQPARSAGEVLT